MKLTTKGAATVTQVKSKFANLQPTYGKNAFDRVAFELPNVPAYLIFFAIGTPSHDDFAQMIKNGFASNASV